MALAAIDFIQRNEALLRAGDGFQQVFAGLRVTQRENRQQPVAHEFQDFAAEFLDGIAHGVEITVEKLDDVVTRPKVGNMGEIAQVADQDRRTHRHAAAARGSAIEDFFAGMRPHIGLQKGARHAVFRRISLTSASAGSRFFKARISLSEKPPGRSLEKVATWRLPKVCSIGQAQ